MSNNDPITDSQKKVLKKILNDSHVGLGKYVVDDRLINKISKEQARKQIAMGDMIFLKGYPEGSTQTFIQIMTVTFKAIERGLLESENYDKQQTKG